MILSVNRLCILTLFFGILTGSAVPAFSSSEISGLESFEGIQPGGNIVSPQGVYLRVIGPVTFSSGVTLSGPFPQPQANNAMVINDFTRGGGYGLGDHGDVTSAGQVPHGSSFLAIDDQNDYRPIEFTFPEDMLKVSALVTGPYVAAFPTSNPAGKTITMTAFDAHGSILASATTSSVHVSLWSSNRLSLNAPGIRKISLMGQQVLVDALSFTNVPEPSSGFMAICFMCAAFIRRR